MWPEVILIRNRKGSVNEYFFQQLHQTILSENDGRHACQFWMMHSVQISWPLTSSTRWWMRAHDWPNNKPSKMNNLMLSNLRRNFGLPSRVYGKVFLIMILIMFSEILKRQKCWSWFDCNGSDLTAKVIGSAVSSRNRWNRSSIYEFRSNANECIRIHRLANTTHVIAYMSMERQFHQLTYESSILLSRHQKKRRSRVNTEHWMAAPCWDIISIKAFRNLPQTPFSPFCHFSAFFFAPPTEWMFD